MCAAVARCAVWIVLAVLCWSPDAAAQPGRALGRPPFAAGGPGPQRHGDPLPPLSRDGQTSGPGVPFRQFMMNDLREHVPLMYHKFELMQQIQKDRAQLQQEKRRIAQGAPKSESELREFHDLLKREDLLTSRQRSLFPQTLAELDAIRAQVQTRRRALEELLPGPEDGRGGAPPGDLPADLRPLSRALRFYTILDNRLAEFGKEPRIGEGMRPFFKGLLNFEELDGPDREHAERRVRMLQDEKERLLRRMEHIDDELEELQRQLGGGERRHFRDSRPPGAPPNRPFQQRPDSSGPKPDR